MRLYQKPSGIWAVDYVDPQTRERRRVSTGRRDKAAARAVAKDIIAGKIEPKSDPRSPHTYRAGIPADQRHGPHFGNGQAAGVSMDALWKRCELTIWHPREIKSLRTTASNLKILREVEIEFPAGTGTLIRFADLPVAEVRFTHLEALSLALFGRGYSAGTVRRKMHMVGASLTQAAKWEIIAARPPMPKLPDGGIRDRVITLDEERAIFAAVEKRREAEPSRDWRRYGYLLRFLMDTACRLGEALAVTADWIEEDAQGRLVLNIPASVTKSGKGRLLPLSDEIIAALPYLKEQAVKGRLFPYTAGTAQYYWRENLVPDLRAQDYEMEGVVLHTFRHTKLTRLAKKPGFGIQRVSKWAGHADIKITAKVYAKLDVDDLWEGV